MTEEEKKQQKIAQDLILVGEKLEELINDILTEFNSKDIKLAHVSSHKRIFIFFLTRSIKSYRAIKTLCKEGFGQDISTLLRSLLESLISVQYILSDPKDADNKAIRFVDYKWIIFKRYISNIREIDTEKIDDLLMKKLISRKDTVLEKFDAFKKKYNIKSDKALVTWSGRTIRDMAKAAGPELLEEYDSTFRLSSRFSHPSIIGDRAYIKYIETNMTFSITSSLIGVATNFRIAISYTLEFLKIFNNAFNLNFAKRLEEIKNDVDKIPHEEPITTHSTTSASLDQKEIKIKFQTPLNNI